MPPYPGAGANGANPRDGEHVAMEPKQWDNTICAVWCFRSLHVLRTEAH